MTATLILLQTAPMGFDNVGWKYYLVIICWSAFFIPGKLATALQVRYMVLIGGF